MASGIAIDIQANNVVLDLNGHKLGNLGAGPGTRAAGISAGNHTNITIRNGTVRGFYTGITLTSNTPTSGGHIVENIRADLNTFTSIRVTGTGNIIRNNLVVATGGSTIVQSAYGIMGGSFFGGSGNRLLNNDVINTVANGSEYAFAILVEGGNATVRGITAP